MPIRRNNRQTCMQDGATVVGAELYSKLQSYLGAYLYEMIEVRSAIVANACVTL